MITKWEIIPAPSEKNPARHKLLIKGEMRDIFLVVKRLGSLCSRPEKASGDFNFTIYLFKLEQDTLPRIKTLISELGAHQEAAAPVPPPDDFETTRRLLTAAAAVPAVQKPAPNNIPQPAVKDGGVLPAVARQNPADAPPAAEISLSASGRVMPVAPPPSSRRKAEPPPPESKPPESKPEEKAKPREATGTASLRSRTKWSVELPLIPTFSFQTLVSGAHNRFAHAAAMAVVENPGVMYNPLLIFGVPGTGKTHLVHAISYGLSSSIGQNNIFVTDGIKLSKGVDVAIKNGTIDSLSETIAKVKVLIIDDIHLLMLTATNRPYITKWLNDFMSKNKQVVVTSVFPPKALAALEEAVSFQFTQGWMVDLKSPAPQTYKVILCQLLQGLDVKLSEEELSVLFTRRSVPFGEAIRTLGSMKKLEKFIVNAMYPATHAQLMDRLLGFSEPKQDVFLTDDEYSPAAAWKPASSASWFKWGIFYPKGMQREASYVLYRMNQCSQELGLKLEWCQLFMEEYNPDELYGIPFKVGNFASEQNANGVVIMGPQSTTPLGAQEAEFRHITLKILDSFLVKGAWMQSGQIKSAAAYTKILMDLL